MWQLGFTKKAEKQLAKLPSRIKEKITVLVLEIIEKVPNRGDWPNFSKLSGNNYHCHIKKGRPTYVMCWREDKTRRIVEVYYVGTHEKAPY